MLFWIITAALALLVALLFTLALWRGAAGSEPTAAYDLRVYRDQLRDVDRDLARGVLGADEAARLRLEISRRVLEADRVARLGGAAARGPKGALIAAAVGILAVFAGSFWLYARLGAVGYADLPLTARMQIAQDLYANRPAQDAAEAEAAATRAAQPAPDPQYANLMERLRAAVAERPNDIEGLTLLVRNEAKLGNFRAAWEAQRRLIALRADQATAADHAQLGELMVVAAGGIVSPQAEAAFTHALELDPREGLSRYYMGLMLVQTGRGDMAFDLWARLLEEGPQDAPWMTPIRANIETLAWMAGKPDYAAPAPRGPDAAAMQAAGQMAPEERQEMIRGMVAGLEDRLMSQGGSAEEWARLVSSLSVLGEADRVKAALTAAEAALANDPAGLEQVRAAAQGGAQ